MQINEIETRDRWMIRNLSEHCVREIKAQAARENRLIRNVVEDALWGYIQNQDYHWKNNSKYPNIEGSNDKNQGGCI